MSGRNLEPELAPTHHHHHHSHAHHRFDQDGLVVPKKLPHPVLESREKKEVHREMMWKLKHGVNPNPRDSELRKAFQRYQSRIRDKQQRDESESYLNLLAEYKQRLHSVSGAERTPTNGEAGEPTDDTEYGELPPATQQSVLEFQRILTRLRSGKSLADTSSNSERQPPPEPSP